MVFKKFTIEEKQAFAARYNAGAKLKDLAAEAGTSIPTMAKYVRAGGGNVRPPGNPNVKKKVPAVVNPTPEGVVAEANAEANKITMVPTTHRKIMSF